MSANDTINHDDAASAAWACEKLVAIINSYETPNQYGELNAALEALEAAKRIECATRPAAAHTNV